MNWNDIKKGDTVKVMFDDDLEVSGKVSWVTSGGITLGNPGLHFAKGNITILEHTPGFRDGDVAIITTNDPGRDWVGIYHAEGRMFTTGTDGVGTLIHKLGYSDEQVASIKVIANINGYNV